MSGPTITVDGRFNGPPDSANGGWVAGLLAGHVPAPAAGVTVTLRRPPPLAHPLPVAVDDDGRARLYTGDGRAPQDVIAEAAATDHVADPPAAVDPADAAAARERFLAFDAHPFPGCVVCGTDRPDGLQVYPGPLVEGRWEHVAAPFTAPPDLAAAPPLLWAVLDCPGGWAAGLARRPALLAGYTVAALAAPAAGEQCVLVGRDDGPRGRSGRAHATRSAAYGADGRLLGHADAVWVALG